MKPRCAQGGAIAIIAVLLLPVLVGACGLALELSLAFQRQAQLQQLADSVALSAAQQLDGTAAGIDTAYSRAVAAMNDREVRGVGTFLLSPSALSFAGSATGPWLDFNAARAAPGGLRFARADMGTLDASFTTLPRAFSRLLGAASATTVGAQAVAGPNGIRVLPLAICAASSTPVALRANGGGANERVDYGFRWGVGYNLLALNPASGAAAGESFLVDPLSPPGSAALASSTEDSQVAPFMCAGKLAYTTVAGRLNLRRNAGFSLWRQLNSRFNDYGGAFPCDPYSAPPDTNVREYFGAQANWMNSNPPQATAASSTPAAGKPLMTIADDPPPLPAVAPAQYGTLWAYGPARKFTSGNFGTGNWSILYPASPALSAPTWPTTAPYGNANYDDPPVENDPGRRERRLLYVPLMSCPIGAGVNVDGEVLAVARFLLTARASATAVPAEFAGILSARELAALATDVELLR